MTKRSGSRTPAVGAGLIVLSSIFYASYGVWTTLMGNFFGGYTASAIKSVMVLALLVPIAVIGRKLGKWNLRRTWPYLLGMVLASIFIWGPLYFAILKGGIGPSLAVNYAAIVIGSFYFGWLIARERFTREKLLATVAGFIGLALVFLPNGHAITWLALGAAVVSGFAGALEIVLTKIIPYNATQSTVAQWVTAAIANIPMVFILGEHVPAIGWHAQWGWLVVFAVASVIASWAFVAGSKVVEAGVAGVLGLLEIVFAVLLGIILFGERPGPIVLLGIFVIILAAMIPYIVRGKGSAARRTVRSELY